LAVVVADEIPVATDTTPVPAEAPVASAIVGCAVTFTPVRAEPVEAVPRPVITESPLPFWFNEPVAAVIAVPRVTFDADNAVPSVGAVPLLPEIIRVSAFVPLPIAKPQVEAEPTDVTFGIDTSELPVTFGTEVVTSLLVAPG
jgi:hypothetical protein